MKTINHKFLSGVLLILWAAFLSNSLICVSIIGAGAMQISFLIENNILKRKLVLVFALLSIIAGILFFIGRWNYGSHFAGTFNNIF
jgi:hypothetical protein